MSQSPSSGWQIRKFKTRGVYRGARQRFQCSFPRSGNSSFGWQNLLRIQISVAQLFKNQDLIRHFGAKTF